MAEEGTTGNPAEPAATPAVTPAPEPPAATPGPTAQQVAELQRQLQEAQQERDGAKKGMYQAFDEKAAIKAQFEQMQAQAESAKPDEVAEFLKNLPDEMSDPAVAKLIKIVAEQNGNIKRIQSELQNVRNETMGIAQRTVESLCADELAKTGAKVPDDWRQSAIEEIRNAAGVKYQRERGNFDMHVRTAAKAYAKRFNALLDSVKTPAPAGEIPGTPPPDIPSAAAAPPSPPSTEPMPDIDTPEFEEQMTEVYNDFLEKQGQ